MRSTFRHQTKGSPRSLVLLAALVAATPFAASVQAQDLGIPDKGFTLQALIEAAKNEPPIVVIDATGKIKDMAENFTAKYGIKATGVKLSGQNQEQVLVREAAAHNVTHDVFNMSNLPSVTTRFLPEGIGVSWMPPDLANEVPKGYQHPAITSLNPWVWAYNTAAYGDKCPVKNMWELTEPKWKGKVSIPDPLLRNETMFWFNQIETHDDQTMRDAYQAHFGKPLGSDVKSATKEWVKQFAANSPNVTRSDTDVGPVVGAKGLKDPHLGFLSAAIFRKENKNDDMAICGEMKPWAGQLTPRVAVIAAGTRSPNAAKLFVHYMMSGEGMGPQLVDGKMATNSKTKMPEDEASGVAKFVDQLHVTNSDTSKDDLAKLQDWQDLWTINAR
ncbi:MAG: ABC transporter substrate-binding protein [Rhodospirillales bacterium]|nr:ABC transporter substrate-binding protein [Rhodospirillales bacterium]